MKWQFIIDSRFVVCANNLQKAERASIWKALSGLEKHPPPPGLNVERLKGNAELESLRVSQQFRLIFLRYPQEGTIVLLYVGNHDEAYSWANRANPPYYKKKEEWDSVEMDSAETFDLDFPEDAGIVANYERDLGSPEDVGIFAYERFDLGLGADPILI
ncbi:MAG: type II toxin-antitoxin system RelE family toxin [Gammaproteobacteria bacterium]